MVQKIYWAVAIVSVVAATVVIGVGWYACETQIHPKRIEERWPVLGEWPRYTLAQFGLPDPENVHFRTSDGLFLAGWFIRGTNPATVILVHGKGSNRAVMLPHAAYLHEGGFSVLLYDSRSRGQSGGSDITFAAKEPLDVKAAVDYVRKLPYADPERIGVQGGSLGAASGILAAADTLEIKGVVAESAFKDIPTAIAEGFRSETSLPSFPFALVAKCICEFRLDVDLDDVAPVRVIAEISPRPVFLIHGEADEQVSKMSFEALWAAAGGPKEKWIVPSASHAKGWQTAPEEYERRVLAFWRKTFGIAQP